MLSVKKEPIMDLPKITEPLEIVNSPGTPSTSNEQDTDGKSENEKTKRKRGRPRRSERKEIKIDIQPQDEIEALIETKILNKSKKIFKIVKDDQTVATPEKANKRKGRKRE